ncbi:MAG: type II secretion system F family protein [Candidatus Omnitrophota bacterium]|nr:type II secretion system F family protein [Candidatus Omnitrophota bacterium]
MPKFFYIAKDKFGEKVNGTEEGISQDEIASRLQARDLLVITITSEEKSVLSSAPDLAKRVFKRNRITNDDRVLFCRQLATLLGAGITILKSVQVIKEQVPSKSFYDALGDLQKRMEAGETFHSAMSKHPKVFSEMWVNLAESGEASGNLGMVLDRLASYLERSAAFKKKIISALAYPSILAFAGTGAILILNVKIIPTFTQLFKQFNLTLPFLTQIIVVISNITTKYFGWLIGCLIVGYFFLQKVLKTKQGRMVFERFLLSLPVFGEFFRVLAVERFTSEMTTLSESGVPILYSLEIVERSVGNLILGEIIKKIKEGVREGKTLSEPLQKSGFFDPMAIQLIGIGEEIGELSNMFKRLNSFYRDYIDTFLTRFTAMFEPLMLIFMGAVIGLMVLGIFLPIFQLAQIK